MRYTKHYSLNVAAFQPPTIVKIPLFIFQWCPLPASFLSTIACLCVGWPWRTRWVLFLLVSWHSFTFLYEVINFLPATCNIWSSFYSPEEQRLQSVTQSFALDKKSVQSCDPCKFSYHIGKYIHTTIYIYLYLRSVFLHPYFHLAYCHKILLSSYAYSKFVADKILLYPLHDWQERTYLIRTLYASMYDFTMSSWNF